MPAATPAPFRDRLHGAVSAAVGRPLTWIVVVALIAAWPIAWALRTPLPPRLPVLGTVPPFELTGQDGGAFGSRDLARSEEHTSELQSQSNLVCRLLLEKKKKK